MKQQSIKLNKIDNNKSISWIEIFQFREKELEREKAIVKENLKILYEKSKNLNKEIPKELLLTIERNQSKKSWFFEKYKEWFE